MFKGRIYSILLTSTTLFINFSYKIVYTVFVIMLSLRLWNSRNPLIITIHQIWRFLNQTIYIENVNKEVFSRRLFKITCIPLPHFTISFVLFMNGIHMYMQTLAEHLSSNDQMNKAQTLDDVFVWCALCKWIICRRGTPSGNFYMLMT